MVDEGLAISTYKRFSHLYVVYKHKEISLKQDDFSRNPIVCTDFVPLIRHTRYIQIISLDDFRVRHLPLNGKAWFGANSLVICVFKHPDKSNFAINQYISSVNIAYSPPVLE